MGRWGREKPEIKKLDAHWHPNGDTYDYAYELYDMEGHIATFYAEDSLKDLLRLVYGTSPHANYPFGLPIHGEVFTFHKVYSPKEIEAGAAKVLTNPRPSARFDGYHSYVEVYEGVSADRDDWVYRFKGSPTRLELVERRDREGTNEAAA